MVPGGRRHISARPNSPASMNSWNSPVQESLVPIPEPISELDDQAKRRPLTSWSEADSQCLLPDQVAIAAMAALTLTACGSRLPCLQLHDFQLHNQGQGVSPAFGRQLEQETGGSTQLRTDITQWLQDLGVQPNQISAPSWLTRFTPPRTLNTPHRLMVLVLDAHLGPGHGIQRRITVERSRPQVGRDALTGRHAPGRGVRRSPRGRPEGPGGCRYVS